MVLPPDSRRDGASDELFPCNVKPSTFTDDKLIVSVNCILNNTGLLTSLVITRSKANTIGGVVSAVKLSALIAFSTGMAVTLLKLVSCMRADVMFMKLSNSLVAKLLICLIAFKSYLDNCIMMTGPSGESEELLVKEY